jgi:hypothetical protein
MSIITQTLQCFLDNCSQHTSKTRHLAVAERLEQARAMPYQRSSSQGGTPTL